MIEEISKNLKLSKSFQITNGTVTFALDGATCFLANHNRIFFTGSLKDCYNLFLKFNSEPKSTSLGQFLQTPDDETFGYTRYLDFRFISELIYEGYLPIAYRDSILYILAKLHSTRSVISLEVKKISKSVKKRKKEFRMMVGFDYKGVCEGVRRVHGEGWLYPEISALFKQVSGYIPSLRVVSVEIYKGDKLVAGEIGYTLGNVYSSLTGFYDHEYPGSGKVQLDALRCLLIKKGYKYWDLGMEMDYKTEMGAVGISRVEWLNLVRYTRDIKTDNLAGYQSGPDLMELFADDGLVK
jgi:Leu/Phe-tRNA-protein transferase